MSEKIGEDFEEFFLVDTAALEIEMPNGEPMLYKGEQVVAHLYGPSTTQFVKAKAAVDKEASKRVINAMGAKGKRKEQEDADADAKFLIAVTDRFDNFPFPGGKEAIYKEQKLKYIHDQVRAHLNDLGNFFTTGTEI